MRRLPMYEIIIKKTSMKLKPESKNYQKVSDTGGSDNGPKYDYVTKPAHEALTTETIYSQTVDELKILDVVMAINGVDFK